MCYHFKRMIGTPHDPSEPGARLRGELGLAASARGAIRVGAPGARFERLAAWCYAERWMSSH